MSEVIYRPATEEDVQAITDIARDIWTMGMSKRLQDRYGPQGGRDWQEWTAQDIGGAVRHRLDTTLVAEIDGRVAGWVSWSINRERQQGQIGYNGVARDCRGLGIGTTLVQMALDELREAGMPLVTVVTGLDEGHAPARRVYERCGFEPIHQSVTYVMELKR